MKLGILIPYYNNNPKCDDLFKDLMHNLKNQLTDDMILYIHEDGQYSSWLQAYGKDNIIIDVSDVNHGISYALNKGLDLLLPICDYILFLDADDTVDGVYLKKMLEACKNKEYEIYESLFYINDNFRPFNPVEMRYGVCGSAFRSDVIGNIRFDEKVQVGEDTRFMKEVYNKNKIRKQLVPCCYFYNYGINGNSLTMRFGRKEIGEYRGE